MRIILGSTSPSRKALLESMGFEFDVVAPDIDEKQIRRDDPRELPLAIAQAKMDAVLKKVEGDAIAITSDMVMIVDGKVREKPRSKEEAYEFIATYARVPQVATSGTVVVNTKTGQRVSAIDEVTVTFAPIPEENTRSFVESGEAMRYAGALAAEHELFLPYVHVDGEWESLLGLPKQKTLDLMFEVMGGGGCCCGATSDGCCSA